MDLSWAVETHVWPISLRFVPIWNRMSLNWWLTKLKYSTRDLSLLRVRKWNLCIQSLRNWVLNRHLRISQFLRFMRNIARKLAILHTRSHQKKKSIHSSVVWNSQCMLLRKLFSCTIYGCGVYLHTFFDFSSLTWLV